MAKKTFNVDESSLEALIAAQKSDDGQESAKDRNAKRRGDEAFAQEKPDYRIKEFGAGDREHGDVYSKWKATSTLKGLPEWGEMDDNAKRSWMVGPGKSAVDEARKVWKVQNTDPRTGKVLAVGARTEGGRAAIADPTASSRNAVSRERQAQIQEESFPTNEHRAQFMEPGGMLHNTAVRTEWPVSAEGRIDKSERVPRLGNPENADEYAPGNETSINRAVKTGAVTESKENFSHHHGLEHVVNGLLNSESRFEPLKGDVSGGFSTSQFAADSPANLMGNLNIRGRATVRPTSSMNAAHRSVLENLATSAKAQAVGMNDKALVHYNLAVNSAHSLAGMVHAARVGRQETSSDIPREWEPISQHLTAYRNLIASKTPTEEAAPAAPAVSAKARSGGMRRV